jgi:hypothetical protein
MVRMILEEQRSLQEDGDKEEAGRSSKLQVRVGRRLRVPDTSMVG